MGLKTTADLVLAGQPEIADRDAVCRVGAAGSSGIRKSVELLDIAERMAGLRFDPGAQTRLQRAVLEFERTARQRGCVGDGHDLGLAVGHGDQHGDQIGGDRAGGLCRLGFSRWPCHVQKVRFCYWRNRR